MNDFELYKLAKRILNGNEEYSPSIIESDDFYDDDNVKKILLRGIDGVARSIEYIDCGELPYITVAQNGFFADFAQRAVKMVIVNCDEIMPDFLEESGVQGLFFADRVKKIRYDVLRCAPRYIYVKESNEYFFAENNVLYSKDKRVLYRYAPGKPEAEYKVLPETEHICHSAFYYAKHLKKLYLPKKLKAKYGFAQELARACDVNDTETIYY